MFASKCPQPVRADVDIMKFQVSLIINCQVLMQVAIVYFREIRI